MPSILSSSTSGMSHSASVIDVVGHNVANVNTGGFKASRVLSQGAPAADVEDGGRRGVATTTIDRDLRGASATPSLPLHFTIQDDAFYPVNAGDGTTVYVRSGALTVDSARNVTTAFGQLLEPPITIPEDHTAPAVTSTGLVTAVNANGEQVEIGQIPFVRFINPQGLEALGGGLYGTTVNSGDPVEGIPGDGDFRELLPGTIEGSNVELVLELTSMLTAQRAYQASARAFRVGDEMLQLATDLTQ
ncbi:MAG: flagellar hook-basal body complex protein [Dehalococcoidia bacterium]